MRNYLILAIASAFLVLGAVSCKKAKVTPNSGGYTASNSNSVNDQWSLVHVYGGLMGLNELHERGEVIWDIDSVNNTVTITNLTITANNNTRFDTGTYSFHMTNNGGLYHLNVDNVDMGKYTISGNEMLLDQNVAADGLYFRFVR